MGKFQTLMIYWDLWTSEETGLSKNLLTMKKGAVADVKLPGAICKLLGWAMITVQLPILMEA